MKIGLLGGALGYQQVALFFDAPFKGVLTLFLLDLGAVAGSHLQGLRTVGGFLLGLAVVAPVVFGVVGVLAATTVGMSAGARRRSVPWRRARHASRHPLRWLWRFPTRIAPTP